MSALPQPSASPSLPAPPRASSAALEVYSTDADDLVGRLLDGRYLVERVLGRGAMGVVLAGQHLFLGRPVAIKVLHPALVAFDEMRARFLREARAASHIRHPAVVSVSDFGVASGPRGDLHYLVMEQLDGIDLLTWAEAQGPLAPEVVVHLGARLCEALAAIHAAGYVHRDVKPENVFVLAGSAPDAPPEVKLLDLGIAALVDEADASEHPRPHRLTRAGQTLGTVLYMSPEQALGHPLDGRADVYSLGCLLWELATGSVVFDGTSSMAIMLKQTAARPEPPSSLAPGVPAWLDRVIMRCLEKRPEDRHASALALREALLAGPGAEPPRALAAPIEVPLLEARHPPRRRVAALVVGGALALTGLALGLTRPWEAPSSPEAIVAIPIPVPTPTAAPASEAAPAPAPDPAPAPEAVPAPEPAPSDAAPREARPDPAEVARPPAKKPAPKRPAPTPAAATEATPAPATEATPATAPPATTPPPETRAPPSTPTGSELWRPEQPTSPP